MIGRTLLVLLVLACLVTGCTGPAPGKHSPATPGGSVAVPAGGGEVVLAPGEAAELPDGTLRYLRLVEDSRCPPDVQCVRAGDATIALGWHPDAGASRRFALRIGADRTGRAAETVGRHRVRLVALERGVAPRATLQIG